MTTSERWIVEPWTAENDAALASAIREPEFQARIAAFTKGATDDHE